MQSPRYCFEVINDLDGQEGLKEAIAKSARVFIARSGAAAIVVPVHIDKNDVQYEDDHPVILDEPIVAENLGVAIAEAMRKASRKPRNTSQPKLSDWPAYKASKARSVSKFEESFIEICIRTVNAANLAAVITGIPEKDALLEVTSTISTGVVLAELGDRVLQVYKACRDHRI